MAQRLITLWARLRHTENDVFAARLTALGDAKQARCLHAPISPFRAAARSL
ncbi:hypothetical protein SAMN05877809_104360 [Rhodobacter sp. JA431]|uniref:hypothetical protein n=1 Tax=Rhodobacter sp. JA431 TaxID=570013 RepID=UPI000BD6AEF9|nr:hypothetical protein [Rhodobacter sp. JA431]SOC08802.1 hypothetical protein SAMN05877809_104360 [Rhodobacter sp. JA431]